MNHSKDSDGQSNIDPSDLAKFQEMRLRRTSPKPDGRNAYDQLQAQLATELSDYASSELTNTKESDLRPQLIERFDELLVAEKIVLKKSEKRRLIEDVLAAVMETFERHK